MTAAVGGRGHPGWRGVAIGVAAVLSVPVVVVLSFLLVPQPDLWRHLAQTVLADYVLNSLALMGGVGIGVAIGGVGAAWLVTMCRFPGGRGLEWALLLPLAMPAYVVAYAYTGVLDFAGPVQTALRAAFGWKTARDYWFADIRSLPGAIAVLTLVLYPYVYVLARAAFLAQSVCVLEAGRTLGCGPWRSFFTVALPLGRGAIATGVALALMETLSDFGTVQYFAVDTFTTGIYRTWLALGQPTAAAQLGAVLMVFVAVLIAIERASRGAGRLHHTTNRYRALTPIRLIRWRAAAALVFCALPVLLGFVVPAGMLAAWAIESGGWAAVDARFLTLARHSLTLAGIAACTAIAIALLLAYAQRLAPSRLVGFGARLAALGYAVPGSVIAVGTLLPAIWVDKALADFLRHHLGVEAGLILTGTVAALIYAYLVRFLAVAGNAVEASLAKVTPSIDAAARMLGQGSVGTLARVHLPMIRGGLLSAGLLVFVDTMKELPATLLMRPFNFDTLATHTFTLASDERLADSAPAALAIVAVGLGPVILLSRAIARSRPGAATGGAA